jgi:hypothetical protein
VKPLASWIAVYYEIENTKIDDTKTFKDQSYTALREKRSQRRKNITGRLDVLHRRTCEVVG